ncbi:MAG: hypothetical protein HUJ29_04015 [Gammaproteobacteria bacterium]|nr:hypothetical protein [Gammaproteobacteria bacterium]
MSPTIANHRRGTGLARCLGSSLILLALLLPLGLQARDNDELASEAVDAMLRLDYARANASLNALQTQAPHYPLLYFLRAGILWVQAEALQGDDKAERVRKWKLATVAYEAAMERAREQLERTPNDPQWRLALGLSQFFIARTYVEQGKVLKIYSNARAGRDTLRKLVEDEPDLYDAYFPLGVYEYIAGSIPRGVNWLAALFDISGDRELGLQYLQLATARASLLAPEAARMLVAAAALQPEYVENACQYLPLARQAHDRYPENAHFSGAYQMLHTNCGYPARALAENKRARKVYLEEFPDMEKILDILLLNALRSQGDIEAIQALKPRFKKKNTAYWHLAMAQAYDVRDQREAALRHYHIIRDGGDSGKNDVLRNSDNKDWLRDQVDIYLRIPYKQPVPAAIDPNHPIQLPE